MRWSCLPVALTAALLSLCAHADQTSWETIPPSTLSTTLVDVLGTDPDYISLLKLLQVTRLIPTLNRLNGSTIFAPTNDAIKRYTKHQQLWASVLEDDSFLVTDNVREELRQQLFYHLLNYTLSNGSDDVVYQQDTLHFPRTSQDSPTHEPPPHPPWMPRAGGSLGGKPQRLRTVTQGEALRVGVDAFGVSGARVVKDRLDASNGAVLGIDHVLEPPPSLSQVVDQLPNAAYFSKILGPEALKRLNSSEAMTLFLPVDDAWKSLDPYERLYLESDFAADDLNRILNMHAIAEDSVKWSDSFGKKGTTFTSLDGTKLEIEVTDNRTTVGSATLIHPDIYASNGVLHLVSDLLIPPGALQITPEKYLLALNCSTFISLIRSVGLRHLVNSTEAHYTILAPSDDILSVLGDESLPDPGSDDLKRMLEYHFIPGKWTPKQLEDGLLLKTELKEEGLNGEPQVLPVDVGDSKKALGGHIRFGGAGVIGEPIQVNGTVIYFISRPLLPPADPLDTVLPDLDLSSFLASVLSSSQSNALRNTPQTSLLIPYNTAFQRLGVLVTTHLLSSNAKPDLEKVLLHHALNSVEYAPELLNSGKQTFQTLEGSDIKVERKSNGTLFVSPSGGWAGMKSQLIPRNTLTKTGVIHELSDILIPRTVDITIGKLIKASQGSTMATLINKAGFDWVLNGTAPPEGSEWEDIGLEGAGWTLLCPPDDAFKDFNLTLLYSDEAAMKDLVAQHLIPVPTPDADLVETDTDVLNNNRPIVLEGSTYSTIRSSSSAYGDLVFQKRITDGEFVVGIKGARGTNSEQDWARVVSWGRSTTGSGTGGVIQIDRLLVPYQPKWWVEYGGPSAVGVSGILAICGFFYGVRIFMLRDTTEATYEPVGGFGRDDDEA